MSTLVLVEAATSLGPLRDGVIDDGPSLSSSNEINSGTSPCF